MYQMKQWSSYGDSGGVGGEVLKMPSYNVRSLRPSKISKAEPWGKRSANINRSKK